jgi:hypothetical protein
MYHRYNPIRVQAPSEYERDSTVKEAHIQLKQPPRPAGGKSIIEEKLGECFYKKKRSKVKSLKIILCGGKSSIADRPEERERWEFWLFSLFSLFCLFLFSVSCSFGCLFLFFLFHLFSVSLCQFPLVYKVIMMEEIAPFNGKRGIGDRRPANRRRRIEDGE